MPYWRLFYHMVWATKERLPLIEPELELDLYRVLVGKAEELGAITYAVGGTENHVHFAASVPPKIALSDFVGQLKGSSSHFVSTRTNAPFTWQSEYGVVSFGIKHLDLVVEYVKNQKQHHKENKLNRFLEKFEIANVSKEAKD